MFQVTETPNSRSTERIAYDPDTFIVRVAFRRKGSVAIWEYFPVAEHDYNAIRDAGSVGSAVDQFLIKGPYQSRRVTE